MKKINVKVVSVLIPPLFERKLNDIRSRASKIVRNTKSGDAAFFERMKYDHAFRSLEDAESAHNEKESDAAWDHLTTAANLVGYLSGLAASRTRSRGRAAIRDYLQQTGGRGGKAKGKRSEQRRAVFASELIAVAPKGGFPNKAAFEVAAKALSEKKKTNFRYTVYQGRLLLKRPDVAAVVKTKGRLAR